MKEWLAEAYTLPAFEWAIDSKSIVFQASEKPGIDTIYMFSKIFHVAVGMGTPEVVTPTFGKLGAMSVSPDGKQIAYLGAVSHNDPIAQSIFNRHRFPEENPEI